MTNFKPSADEHLKITDLETRLKHKINIDILKVKNPWVVSNFRNVKFGGLFRWNRSFYTKTSNFSARATYTRINVLFKNEDLKVLSFDEYLDVQRFVVT